MVILTGRVDRLAEKGLAGEYARDVEGVKAVRNQLVIARNPHKAHSRLERVDDLSITAQIKTSLCYHKSVQAMAAQVSTREGEVTVHGMARTEAERNLITKLARDIKGVRHVNNYMTTAQP